MLIPEPVLGEGGSSGAGKGVNFAHTPPRPQDLPYPGQSITLYAYLTNTRETRFPLRVSMSRDGRFEEVIAKDAYLDKEDRPTYEITVPAPVGEMTYQMFLVNPDGNILPSPRFAVRRSCVPQVELAQGEVPADVQGVDRLRRLVAESKGLENDLSGYNQVLRLLGQLKGVLGE